MPHPKHPVRITSRGIVVRPVYYREVPEFDPDRGGKEWYEARRKKEGEKKFNQEYEIDFDAAEGGLVYPHWSVRDDVLSMPISLSPDWRYVLIIDPGVLVTAALLKAQTPDGYLLNVAEYYAGSGVKGSSPMSATEHAGFLLQLLQGKADEAFGLSDDGQSNIEGIELVETVIIDPSAYRKEASSEQLASVAQRYIDAGFYCLERGTKDLMGGIDRVKELELPVKGVKHPLGRSGDAFPVKYTFPGLKNYRWEKKNYHYPKPNDRTSEVRLDKPVKKHDHLMDCDRMGDVHMVYTKPADKDKREKSKWDKQLEKLMQKPNERGIGIWDNLTKS